VPYYSTSIEGAWAVVERLGELAPPGRPNEEIQER
jgi:hypothetical protein